MKKIKGIRSAWNDFRVHVCVSFEHEEQAKKAFYAGAAWTAGRLKEQAQETLDVVLEKLCESKK